MLLCSPCVFQQKVWEKCAGGARGKDAILNHGLGSWSGQSLSTFGFHL